jgi:putative ABC transport system permease protein
VTDRTTNSSRPDPDDPDSRPTSSDSTPPVPEPSPLRAARLAPADVVRLGGTGLRTRPLRVFLSALGIAIGVAAMIAVVGISGSGQAEVDRRLDALGTNLLRVAPGRTLAGDEAELPPESVAMIHRVPPVRQVAATGETRANIYRNERIAIGRTGSLHVLAAGADLLPAVGGQVREGAGWTPRRRSTRLSCSARPQPDGSTCTPPAPGSGWASAGSR